MSVAASLNADLAAEAELAIRLERQSVINELAAEMRALREALSPRGRWQIAFVIAVDERTIPKPISLPDGQWSLRRLAFINLPGFSGSVADVPIHRLLPFGFLGRVSPTAPLYYDFDWSIPRDIAPEITVANVSGSTGAVGILFHAERESL